MEFTLTKMVLCTKAIGKMILNVVPELKLGQKAQNMRACMLMDKNMDKVLTNGLMVQSILVTGIKTK